MEKGLELVAVLRSRVQQLAASLPRSASPQERRVTQVAEGEGRQLEASLLQLNQAIELLNKADSSSMAVNRDNSVLKYNSVVRQYEGVEKGRRRWMMRYVYRIKLICRWRTLDKKRQ